MKRFFEIIKKYYVLEIISFLFSLVMVAIYLMSAIQFAKEGAWYLFGSLIGAATVYLILSLTTQFDILFISKIRHDHLKNKDELKVLVLSGCVCLVLMALTTSIDNAFIRDTKIAYLPRYFVYFQLAFTIFRVVMVTIDYFKRNRRMEFVSFGYDCIRFCSIVFAFQLTITLFSFMGKGDAGQFRIVDIAINFISIALMFVVAIRCFYIAHKYSRIIKKYPWIRFGRDHQNSIEKRIK